MNMLRGNKREKSTYGIHYLFIADSICFSRSAVWRKS